MHLVISLNWIENASSPIYFLKPLIGYIFVRQLKPIKIFNAKK